MLKKYNDDHVPAEKIKLINDLLSDPIVNETWCRYVRLGEINASVSEREKAFQEYCHFRDLFLGLPPLKITPIQGTHRKNMV